MPPMPTTERAAPPQSTTREPVYFASFTRAIPESTTAMTTASSANPTRQVQTVVMKPPRSGPTAAAMAAEAPTRAYTRFCCAPSKLPWMRDCMAGRRSDAPMPPMTAQKMTTAVRSCAKTIAIAPTAYPRSPRT